MTFIRKALRIPAVLAFLLSLSSIAVGQQAQAPAPLRYQNPVIRGDFPDPTVIRAGDDFWALTTSGGWEPEFPILHSRDLVNWEIVGAVFQEKPSWARGDFWAPEISEHNGEFYVYYAARKKKGPLCVAVAKSPAPQGPWVDHGPLVCQDDGSIDAFAATDENGGRVLFWKEDGNSRNLPTPIWAQRLSPDGTKLVGEKKEVIRNDVAWEKKVVEGEFILHRSGYFYMFYAGAGCCGLECDYAIGVARAQNLMGPWEKFSGNPILAGNERWRCPGHGSIVQDRSGRSFYMFHSYENGKFHLGRQAVLEELKWREDGWPVLATNGVNDWSPAPFESAQFRAPFVDAFRQPAISAGWEWPSGHRPGMETGKDGLLLSPSSAARDNGALITRRIAEPEFVVRAVLDPKGGKGEAGLTVFGDHGNSVGIGINGTKLFSWQVRNGKKAVMYSITRQWLAINLRITARAETFHFEVSEDGRSWEPLGADIPDPFHRGWDGAIRAGLYTGKGTSRARFRIFELDDVGVFAGN